MSTNTNLAKKEQDAAIAEMSPELKEVHEAIKKEVKSLTDANIMARYRVGKHVAVVTGNERKYGESAVATLAIALGGTVSDTMLWEYRRLANSFTETGLKKMMDKQTRGGRYITYNHLRLIANLKPNERTAMVKKVFIEDLTTDELAAAIQKKAGGKRSSGGRRPQAPKTITAGLSQIDKLGSDIHKRMTIWDKAVFERATKGPADNIDDGTLKGIQVTQKSVATMVKDGEVLLGRLTKAEARAVKVIAVKKAQGGAPRRSTKKAARRKKKTGGAAAKVAAAKKKRRTAQPAPA